MFYTNNQGYRMNKDGEYEHRKVWEEAYGPIPPGYSIDHIDGDKCNNELSNLRICSQSQNQCNRGKQANNTSGYKGVSWDKSCRKWRVKIRAEGKEIWGGYYNELEDAATAYNFLAAKYHGEFAHYNKP